MTGQMIVRITRNSMGYITNDGEVNDDAYNTIRGRDFSTQKARILLMLSMLKTKDRKEIQEIFDTH